MQILSIYESFTYSLSFLAIFKLSDISYIIFELEKQKNPGKIYTMSL